MPLENVKVKVKGTSDTVPGALTMESVMFPNGVTVPEPERLAPIATVPVPWPDALMEIWLVCALRLPRHSGRANARENEENLKDNSILV